MPSESLINQEVDEETGLLFFDPQQEEKARREKDFIEKQKNMQNLLKDVNGQTNAALQASTSAMMNKGHGNQRQNFLTSLKHMQNKKHAMSIEKIKSTFVATELIPEATGSKSKSKVDDLGLLEDRDSDSEFDPEANEMNHAPAQVWDDEENLIHENAPQDDQEEGEEELSQHLSAQEDEKMSDAASEQSQIVAPKRRVVADISSNASQASVLRKQKLKQRNNKARGFFDEEAELGSDDENNDDVKKQINKKDVEENEEGLDSDLEGFVDKGDQELVPDAEQDALDKY